MSPEVDLQAMREHLKGVIQRLEEFSELEEDADGALDFRCPRLHYRMLFSSKDPCYVRVVYHGRLPILATASSISSLDKRINYINLWLKFAKVSRLPEPDSLGNIRVDVFVDFVALSPSQITDYTLHRYIGMILSGVVLLARWGTSEIGSEPTGLPN